MHFQTRDSANCRAWASSLNNHSACSCMVSAIAAAPPQSAWIILQPSDYKIHPGFFYMHPIWQFLSRRVLLKLICDNLGNDNLTCQLQQMKRIRLAKMQ